MTVQKELVTRNEVRAMGLNYTSMHFWRLERPEYNRKTGAFVRPALLTPLKLFGRSSRVHYRIEEVQALIAARTSQAKLTARKAA